MSTEEADSSGSSWTFWKVLLILNAIIGLMCFEYAWFKFRRFRNPNRDLDALYPAYARTDVQNWQKWRFYPGAIFLLVPRLLLAVIFCLNLFCWLKLFMIGHEEGTPLTGVRRWFVRVWFQFTVTAIATIGFFTSLGCEHISHEQVNFYEEYLGSKDEQRYCQQAPQADPRVPKRGQGQPSIIVCNHTGWMEIMTLIRSPVFPGFTPKKQTKKVPVLSTFVECL